MRIGFEAKRATHNFRGLGNYSRGLIEGLLEYQSGIDLFLFSPPITNPRGQEWVNSLPSNAHLKLPHTFLEKKLSTIWRSFLMSNDLKKEKLDLFHGLSHEIPHRLDKLPFKKVVTMHDLIYLRYPEFFPFIDRAVYSQKFKYACKHSDLVIAICEQTREDLIKFLGVNENKIVVHYQSCDPIFYNERSPDELQLVCKKYQLEKPFILNVGAFEDRKNQLTLLESFAEIANQIDEDLVFIGQGKKYKERVKERIEELKLNQRVHILDSVKFEELPLMYQASKVFCFPSLFEGFGIPVTEALFSKTPVITSFGSSLPESAGPDSYFIEPLSQSSISNALLKVLGDQKLRDHMIERGFSYVSRFHRRESTARLMELYTQVTAN